MRNGGEGVRRTTLEKRDFQFFYVHLYAHFIFACLGLLWHLLDSRHGLEPASPDPFTLALVASERAKGLAGLPLGQTTSASV